MATKAALIARVLSILKAVNAGETPSTEDTAVVTAMIQPKLDELARRSVVYIADGDSVEDAQLQWVAMLIAQDLAPDYGASIDPGAIQLAESRLREMESNQVGGPVKACYF